MNPSTTHNSGKFLSLGSNLGDRKKQLFEALTLLRDICRVKRISPLYETPALLPESSPESWNQPFINLVVEVECNQTPNSFLESIQDIERKLGRIQSDHWAPRPIDIDIILWDDLQLRTENLEIPHPEMLKRSFVLDPLKDLNSRFTTRARTLNHHAPLLMAILNATPDSFSDGLIHNNLADFKTYFSKLLEIGLPIVDIGAESTRPGATPLTAEEEWKRLEPFLLEVNSHRSSHTFFPQISVDTYHPSVARKALKLRVDIINDVSGLSHPEMLSVLKDSECHYILTHRLGIPANPKNTLRGDPIDLLNKWFEEKWEVLNRNSISSERIIFDPGIGFGKSHVQSLKIIKGLHHFRETPFRIMMGHSRKSFYNQFTKLSPKERDMETLGTSLALVEQGVDILRIHDAFNHKKTIQGWLHARR